MSPQKSGFSFVAKRGEVRPPRQALQDGHQTLRFGADGSRLQAQKPDAQLVAKINAVFEEYLGLHDDELALSIWELGRDCTDLLGMDQKLRASAELAAFAFPDELVFDMWGIVDDQKRRQAGQADLD